MTAPKTPRATPRRAAQAFVDELRRAASEEVFGIAELAQEFGVTHRAMRLYEEKGLLSPRRVGARRLYSRRDRARLVLILRAKALGSSLEDIKAYLDLYGAHGEGRARQLAFVIDKVTHAIGELEAKRAQIDRSLEELRHIAESCRAQLGTSPRARPAAASAEARAGRRPRGRRRG